MAVEISEEMSKNSNLTFSKQLASNDKKIRDKAVKKLGLFLSCKRDLSEVDLRKILKGIFYCMWMSDLPLVQEELAVKLSELIHKFPEVEDALGFIEMFFVVMNREWEGIDKLRMDKFMMLTRRFLGEAFNLARDCGFESEMVGALCEIFEEGPTMSEEGKEGLRLHFADMFVPELAKVFNGLEKKHEKEYIPLMLLEPFYDVMGKTKNVAVFRRVKENIFEHLMRNAEAAINAEDEEDGEKKKEDESNLVLTQWAPVVYRLLEVAKAETTVDSETEKVYTF